MEAIYLDIINSLIASKQVTLEDFNSYVERLFLEDKAVCIYNTVFEKNASTCFKSYKEFTTWWDAVEAKKDGLLKKIEASKIKTTEI
jgi:hypothetical protein